MFTVGKLQDLRMLISSSPAVWVAVGLPLPELVVESALARRHSYPGLQILREGIRAV